MPPATGRSDSTPNAETRCSFARLPDCAPPTCNCTFPSGAARAHEGGDAFLFAREQAAEIELVADRAEVVRLGEVRAEQVLPTRLRISGSAGLKPRSSFSHQVGTSQKPWLTSYQR